MSVCLLSGVFSIKAFWQQQSVHSCLAATLTFCGSSFWFLEKVPIINSFWLNKQQMRQNPIILLLKKGHLIKTDFNCISISQCSDTHAHTWGFSASKLVKFSLQKQHVWLALHWKFGLMWNQMYFSSGNIQESGKVISCGYTHPQHRHCKNNICVPQLGQTVKMN